LYIQVIYHYGNVLYDGLTVIFSLATVESYSTHLEIRESPSFRDNCLILFLPLNKYGTRLAKELDARFMPIDISRTAVPISASAIRANPDIYWHFLPKPVKAFYCQRISIFGAKSTGKATLAKRLSETYSATYVPEYARTLLELQQGELQQGDFLRIAYAQAASEDTLAQQGKAFINL